MMTPEEYQLKAFSVMERLITHQLEIVARDQSILEDYKARPSANVLIINARQQSLNERFASLTNMQQIFQRIMANEETLLNQTFELGKEYGIQMWDWGETLGRVGQQLGHLNSFTINDLKHKLFPLHKLTKTTAA